MKAEPTSRSHSGERRTQRQTQRRSSRASRALKPTPTADPILVQRPDGIYWQAEDGEEAFGPFETYELARADFLRGDEERPTPGETVDEAEGELGLNDWVDEETGQVAEGQCPPRLPPP